MINGTEKILLNQSRRAGLPVGQVNRVCAAGPALLGRPFAQTRAAGAIWCSAGGRRPFLNPDKARADKSSLRKGV